MAELHRRTRWLRLGRTGRTWDALLPAVLEQKVTTVEANRVWRELLRLAGDPAPGPAPEGMRVPPSAQRVLDVTDWEWHRCGLDGARRRAVRAVASVASRLEPETAGDSPAMQRRLCSIPGIGVWTAAEVVQRTLGCPDTVSVGDYHLKNLVGFALTGRRNTDDAEMLELLEPWRGHRQRVVRLLLVGGARPAAARAALRADELPGHADPAAPDQLPGAPAGIRSGMSRASAGLSAHPRVRLCAGQLPSVWRSSWET